MWEQTKEILDLIVNSPLFTAIASIAGTVGGIFVIFKNTSFGKKAIAKMQESTNQAHEEVKQALVLVDKTIDSVKEAKQNIQEEVAKHTKEIENKVVAVYSSFQLEQENLFKILEVIPNTKVQELVKEWKEKVIAHEGDLEELLGDTYSLIKKQLEEQANEKIRLLEQKVEELQNSINKAKELIPEQEEVTEDEREETKEDI